MDTINDKCSKFQKGDRASEGCIGRNGAPISVLVVGDEVIINNLVADCLTASGFAVLEVTTADEALWCIDSGADVDVLFTHVKLALFMVKPNDPADFCALLTRLTVAGDSWP